MTRGLDTLRAGLWWVALAAVGWPAAAARLYGTEARQAEQRMRVLNRRRG